MLKKDKSRDWGGIDALELYKIDRAKALKKGRHEYTKMHTPAGAHTCAHAHIRLRALCNFFGFVGFSLLYYKS